MCLRRRIVTNCVVIDSHYGLVSGCLKVSAYFSAHIYTLNLMPICFIERSVIIVLIYYFGKALVFI